MTRSIGLSIVLGIATGCVDEYDPEVIVVLPDVPDPCGTIGAAVARIEIETTSDEAFEVTADACGRLPGQQVSGFLVPLSRLTYGYHRAAIALVDAEGGELGRIDRPFAANTPVVAAFAFADLPAWPTAPLALGFTSCPTPEIELTITPSLATRPSFLATVPCEAATVATPRGPVTVEARAGCDSARGETFVAAPQPAFPDEPIILDFLPSECP